MGQGKPDPLGESPDKRTINLDFDMVAEYFQSVSDTQYVAQDCHFLPVQGFTVSGRMSPATDWVAITMTPICRGADSVVLYLSHAPATPKSHFCPNDEMEPVVAISIEDLGNMCLQLDLRGQGSFNFDFYSEEDIARVFDLLLTHVLEHNVRCHAANISWVPVTLQVYAHDIATLRILLGADFHAADESQEGLAQTMARQDLDLPETILLTKQINPMLMHSQQETPDGSSRLPN